MRAVNTGLRKFIRILPGYCIEGTPLWRYRGSRCPTILSGLLRSEKKVVPGNYFGVHRGLLVNRPFTNPIWYTTSAPNARLSSPEAIANLRDTL
jgi:hypothetical protein